MLALLSNVDLIKVGSQYDASPQHARDAEIEINSILAFVLGIAHASHTRRALASYCEPTLRISLKLRHLLYNGDTVHIPD